LSLEYCVIIANERFQIVAKLIPQRLLQKLCLKGCFFEVFKLDKQPALTIQLFGTFQVLVGGMPVNGFRSDKVRALLAYLAVEADRPHRRDALAGLLWTDMSDVKAHDNLRLALHRLRQSLGASAAEAHLSVTPKTIQLLVSPECMVDVAAFERLLFERRAHRCLGRVDCSPCTRRLIQAAALYRGDLLPGFFVESQLFEEWLTVRREGLSEQVLEAQSWLASHYEGCQDYAQAIYYARRQLEMDPWREDAQRRLMRCLALSGQRAAALIQYDACVHLLAEHVGVKPDDETQALYERIQKGMALEPDVQTDPFG
jgi:DNA-binding SARP family transcriptional activator